MKKQADFQEQVKVFRAVAEKALGFGSDEEMKDYLSAEFAGSHDLFCRFIGFCSAEFKCPAVKIERHKLVMFMTAVAMEGLSQGRTDDNG